MKNILLLFPLLLGFFAHALAQGDQKPDPNFGFVVEVIYAKGSPIAFQKVGQEAVYYGYSPLPGWSRKPGELAVQGVRVVPRLEAGEVKLKVTAYRGDHQEAEDTVGEYTLSERTTVLDELRNFGVVPFEARLVHASQTVANLPTVVNKTKSLIVTVEPNSSTMPNFKMKVLNSSAKPVFGFAFNVYSEGKARLMGVPRGEDGANLIEPGAAYESKAGYPTQLVRESSAVPPTTMSSAELQILSVVFADGSTEGDGGPAVRLRAYQLGAKVQLSRILSILRSGAATDPDTLSAKIEKSPVSISSDDMSSILNAFTGLAPSELEAARASAEFSAMEARNDFKKVFAKGSFVPGDAFNDAVKAAILKCESLIEALP